MNRGDFSPLYSNLVVETLEMDEFAQGECGEKAFNGILRTSRVQWRWGRDDQGKVVQNWGKTRREHLSGPTKPVLKVLIEFRPV